MRLLAGIGLALAIASTALASTAGRFTLHGTVVAVQSATGLVVKLDSGKTERVTLVGVAGPRSGGCYSATARQVATRLALRKQVTLKGDRTRQTRSSGRLLAYVWLPHGKDLGFQIIAAGAAKPVTVGKRYERYSPYVNAAARAKGSRRGLWRACAPKPMRAVGSPTSKPKPTPSPGKGCHPNYTPCLPIVGDLDCSEIDDSLKPIHIHGADPYRLDRDHDGLGCEPEG